MFITPNFTLEEMIVSQVAAREGLDNTPSQQVISNLHLLCEALERVRALFGLPVIISSGYRSPALNKRIGGSPRSPPGERKRSEFRPDDSGVRQLGPPVGNAERPAPSSADHPQGYRLPARFAVSRG
jgi:zinc D-Ala-D-Ala carboxypeptidase